MQRPCTGRRVGQLEHAAFVGHRDQLLVAGRCRHRGAGNGQAAERDLARVLATSQHMVHADDQEDGDQRQTSNGKHEAREALVFGVRLVRIVSVFGRVLNAIDHDDV